MSRDELLCTIWVCQCCMLVHANGECCADDAHGGDGREPLSLIDGRHSLTAGLLAEEHAEDCEVRITGSWPDNYECDCEHDDFSTSPCDGCGSYLHGDRYALALWREATSV